MVSLLVRQHVALIVVPVLAAIPALERVRAQMNVPLVRDKRLPRSETFSTVAAVEQFVLLCCVHRFHVQLDSTENPTTDVAGGLWSVETPLVIPQMIRILHYNVAFRTFPRFVIVFSFFVIFQC